MEKECISCGRKVAESLIDPKKENSHGAGIWRCGCGTIMRNNIPSGNLYSRFKGFGPKIETVFPRPISGKVIGEGQGNHGRMY